MISGWWYTYSSEKYEKVSWDDSSQYIGKIIQMFQTTKQYIYIIIYILSYIIHHKYSPSSIIFPEINHP